MENGKFAKIRNAAKKAMCYITNNLFTLFSGLKAGVYIMQNTMVRGGEMASRGKKMKLGVREKK